MQTSRKHRLMILFAGSLLGVLPLCVASTVLAIPGFEQERPFTPLQMEIEKQRMRLSSTELEERRDALTRLGSMHHPDASRAALAGLGDPVAIVKVTAAGAILSLPADESARHLIPLLNDKVDSVRGAAAVALGEIGDETAVSPLASVLNPQLGLVATKRKQKKKKAENPFVLRAAARSLGQIGDRAGLPTL